MNRRSIWLAIMIGGSVSAVLGACGGGALLLLGLLTAGPNSPANPLPGGSIVALSLGLGGSVAYQGWAGWRGRSTRAFPSLRLRWLVVALVAAIALGAVVAPTAGIAAVFAGCAIFTVAKRFFARLCA